MSRAQNYEFQEWWNKQREYLDNNSSSSNATCATFSSSSNNILNKHDILAVDIRSSSISSDPTVSRNPRTRSARQISWLWLLKLHQLASSVSWLASSALYLLRTANRRITNSAASSASSPSRLYRIIRVFLGLTVSLLVFELAAYFKGWHFTPPSVESAEEAVERLYARWLGIRAEYLAPPLQSLANVCIVLFLIQSVDRIVLVFGCIWIKFRGLTPVATVEYGGGGVGEVPLVEEGQSVEDYPMVLVQIPMCNEREVS